MNPYINLKSPQNTGSGVADSFLWAPIEDFTNIACWTAPVSASPGSDAIITDDHTFSAGKGFREFVCAPFKNHLDAATIGEVGSQKLDETLEVILAGSYPEQHEFIKNAMNKPGIVLVKDGNCSADMWYQIGCDCIYAWMTTEFKTGTLKDGQKGYIVKFSSPSEAIYTYAGTVTKQP